MKKALITVLCIVFFPIALVVYVLLALAKSSK